MDWNLEERLAGILRLNSTMLWKKQISLIKNSRIYFDFLIV